MIDTVISRKYNRRYRFRIFVGMGGVARLGTSRRTADVNVKDVSMTGFAITTSVQDEVRKSDSVRVTFDDSGFRMALNGICVRKQQIDEHRVLYGCIYEDQPEKLEEYIAEKQRVQMQKHQGRRGRADADDSDKKE